MGFFYFDESIHPRGEFSLGAFVYAEESLDSEVAEALRQSGMVPRVDEFKSGARMDQSPEQARARDKLKSLVHRRCGIGVVVAPDCPRTNLGCESFVGLAKILATMQFSSSSHEVFFDEGVFTSSAAGQRAAESFRPSQPCNLHFEQDSVQILGLQVADLVAHTCSGMLLSQLDLVRKTVKAGENSGYDRTNLDMDLGFELWATLRYNFFAAPPPPPESWKSQLDWEADVASRGLHVAETWDSTVRDAASARFGHMYLGCIH